MHREYGLLYNVIIDDSFASLNISYHAIIVGGFGIAWQYLISATVSLKYI